MEKYTIEEIKILLEDIKKIDDLNLEENSKQSLETIKNKEFRNIMKNVIENKNEELWGKEIKDIIIPRIDLSIFTEETKDELRKIMLRFGAVLSSENIIEFVKNKPDLVGDVWCYTYKEVQKEKIAEVIELVKDKPNLVEDVWVNTYEEVQKEKIAEVIELVKDKPDLVREVWFYTFEEVKKEKIVEVIDLVKDNPDLVKKVWVETTKKIKLNKFIEISEIIKQSKNKELYNNFVKEYLGPNIEFSEDGSFILPDDLKRIVFNENDEKRVSEIDKKLPLIIENWNEIKLYIQRKRANSIIKDGIEIRGNSINEILEAVVAIDRPIANSVSAEEFERTKGAERVGTDTQYTASPSTAVQRAHSLAEKMDEVSSIKKFPDFSVQNQNGQICLNVLHPQDKSAILLGYDTCCCFRPNGNADNSAKNEYSLLQYCTTTPYGGVLRCESADKSEIYMGTPFLVNGNCMMFHSYETAKGKKANETNELLIEAAQSAIEKSNSSIDVVFMTSLHAGNDSLHTEDKISISSYFRVYTEGEYSNYQGMYNNLDGYNCILAARVGNKILTGEELVKWYKEECHSSPEELKQKLQLHFGERTEEFDFGRREIREQLDISELPLLQAFQKRRKDLQEKREILALELQKKKLEVRKELINAKEKEELAIIQSKLEGKEISKKTINELREELQQTRNAELELYSGRDIDLIAEVYGINLEEELRKRAEESEKSRKPKDKKKCGEGKAISILMARTRESDDERVKAISNLKQKIAQNELSDEELEVLEQAGIDVTEYKKVFRSDVDGKEGPKSSENQSQKDPRVEQKVKQGMKNTAEKEEIVAEKLFERVSEEEIKIKSKRILRESIVGELKQKAAVIQKRKGLEELTEEEMQEIDQEVQRFDITGLTEGIVNGDISEEQQKQLEELKKSEYEFDIGSHKAKIEDKSKLEKRIRMDKLAKLKAGITIGIETQKKIKMIKGRIDGEERRDENISKFIYGNSWYIALDEEGYVIDSKINPELAGNGEENDIYEKTLEGEKKREIQPELIREITEKITVQEKQEATEEISETNEEKKGVVLQ